MTKYRIEKRPVGWRRYRVLALGVKPLIGPKTVDRVVCECLTLWGAERFIALRAWSAVSHPQPEQPSRTGGNIPPAPPPPPAPGRNPATGKISDHPSGPVQRAR